MSKVTLFRRRTPRVVGTSTNENSSAVENNNQIDNDVKRTEFSPYKYSSISSQHHHQDADTTLPPGCIPDCDDNDDDNGEKMTNRSQTTRVRNYDTTSSTIVNSTTNDGLHHQVSLDKSSDSTANYAASGSLAIGTSTTTAPPSPTNLRGAVSKDLLLKSPDGKRTATVISSTNSSPSKAVTAFELAMKFAASTHDDGFAFDETPDDAYNNSHYHQHQNQDLATVSSIEPKELTFSETVDRKQHSHHYLNDKDESKNKITPSAAAGTSSGSGTNNNNKIKKVKLVNKKRKKKNNKDKNSLNLSSTAPLSALDQNKNIMTMMNKSTDGGQSSSNEDKDEEDSDDYDEYESISNTTVDEDDSNEKTTMFDVVNHLHKVERRNSSRLKLNTNNNNNNRNRSNSLHAASPSALNNARNNNNVVTGRDQFSAVLPASLRDAKAFDRLQSYHLQHQQERRSSGQTVFSSQGDVFSASDAFLFTPGTESLTSMQNVFNNNDDQSRHRNNNDDGVSSGDNTMGTIIRPLPGEGIAEAILRQEREKQYRLVDRAKVIARRLLREADREITIMISKTADEAAKVEATKRALEILDENMSFSSMNNNNNAPIINLHLSGSASSHHHTSSSNNNGGNHLQPSLLSATAGGNQQQQQLNASYNCNSTSSIAEVLLATIQEQRLNNSRMFATSMNSALRNSTVYNNEDMEEDDDDPEVQRRKQIERKAEEDLEIEMNQKLNDLNKNLESRTKAIRNAASSLGSYRHAQQEKPKEMFELSQATKRHKERKKKMLDGRRKSGIRRNNFDDGAAPPTGFGGPNNMSIHQDGSGNFEDGDENQFHYTQSEGFEFCRNLVEDEIVYDRLGEELDRLFAEEKQRELSQLDSLNNTEAAKRELLRRQTAARMEAQKNASEAAWLMSSGDPKLTQIRAAAMQRRQEEAKRAKEKLEQDLRDAESKFHHVRMKVDGSYRQEIEIKEASKNEQTPKALADLKAEMELLEREQKLLEKQAVEEEDKKKEIQRQVREVEDAEREAMEVEQRINKIATRGAHHQQFNDSSTDLHNFSAFSESGQNAIGDSSNLLLLSPGGRSSSQHNHDNESIDSPTHLLSRAASNNTFRRQQSSSSPPRSHSPMLARSYNNNNNAVHQNQNQHGHHHNQLPPLSLQHQHIHGSSGYFIRGVSPSSPRSPSGNMNQTVSSFQSHRSVNSSPFLNRTHASFNASSTTYNNNNNNNNNHNRSGGSSLTQLPSNRSLHSYRVKNSSNNIGDTNSSFRAMFGGGANTTNNNNINAHHQHQHKTPPRVPREKESVSVASSRESSILECDDNRNVPQEERNAGGRVTLHHRKLGVSSDLN